MESTTILSALRSEKLKDSSQWQSWHQRMKVFAKRRDIWDLCNPDTDELHRPEVLIEPIAPEYPDDGSQEDQRRWRDRLEVYKIKANRWDRQRKSLNEMDDLIINSLDASLREAVMKCESPYDRLVYLSKRFARSDAYTEEIRMQWKAFSAQKPTGDVEKWLISWVELYEQALSLKISETASANKDFLQAVKEVLPIWWQARFQEIVMEKASIETQSLIESFRSTYREIGPNALSTQPAGLKGSFSTWQGHQEAKQETKNEVKNLPFEQRPCPCGMKYHGPATCYHLNAKMRPSGWRKEKRKVDKIEREFATDPAWEKWVREAVEKANLKNASNSSNSSNATLIRPGNMAFSSQAIGPAAASLKKRWILDSGSNVHVCNEKSRFVNLQLCEEMLATGEGDTAVIGRGTVRLTGVDPISKQERVITLSDACYAPGFHVNLVSYAKLKDKGGKWCESGGYIQDHEAIPIVSLRLWLDVGLWVFDQPEREAIRNVVNAVRSSSTPLNETASAELWHRRLGHPQYKTVQQMTKLVDGVTIDGNHEAQAICETCQLGRANRQVSRRPRGRIFGRFGMVHFDLIQLSYAYNKHRWISHFYIEGIRFHWLMTHEVKPECQQAINQFVDLARNWWNLPIKAFNYDNENAAGRTAEHGLTSDGIVVYHSPPRHPEMNGHAERAGGVIIQRMRMLMLEGKLPKELWPEAAMAAAWLLNRTPTYLASENRWIVPWSEVVKQFITAGDATPRINLSNVRLYGSLAYCRIEKQVQSDKMNPRAEVGFMVGYIASNIWRIWFPQSGKVKLVRDVVFDEKRRYSPDFQQLQQIPLPLVKEPQELDQAEVDAVLQATMRTGSVPELEASNNVNDVDASNASNANNEEVQNNESQCETLNVEQRDRFSAEKKSQAEAAPKASQNARLQEVYRTPDRQIDAISGVPGAFPQEITLPPTPPDEQASPVPSQGVETAPATPEVLRNDQPQEPQHREQVDSDDEAEMQLQADLLAPRDINGDVDEANIVTGSRRRTAKRDDAYAYSVMIEPPAYLHAFAAGLYSEKPISRRHRDDLPELPKHWKDVMNHLF
jgi:hypothetical protein